MALPFKGGAIFVPRRTTREQPGLELERRRARFMGVRERQNLAGACLLGVAMSRTTADEEDAFLRALGSLVANFAALEESLADAIFMAAGGKGQVVPILTAGMAFRALVRKFGAVCVTASPPLGSREDIGKLCSILDKINDDRNNVIHSAWSTTGPAGMPRRHKVSADARKGLRLNPQDVPVSEIRTLIARIEEGDRKIWELVVDATPA